MARNMNAIDWVAFVLVVIGSLNWGLAIWDVNLVAAIFGTGIFASIIYALVAISGLYMIYSIFK